MRSGSVEIEEGRLRATQLRQGMELKRAMKAVCWRLFSGRTAASRLYDACTSAPVYPETVNNEKRDFRSDFFLRGLQPR